MIAFQFPDSFAGGVECTIALWLLVRTLVELHRCSKGWRR